MEMRDALENFIHKLKIQLEDKTVRVSGMKISILIESLTYRIKLNKLEIDSDEKFITDLNTILSNLTETEDQ